MATQIRNKFTAFALPTFFPINQFVIAARGSLAAFPLSPRNDGDYKNHNRPSAAIHFFVYKTLQWRMIERGYFGTSRWKRSLSRAMMAL
jgi:hypothetical protein